MAVEGAFGDLRKLAEWFAASPSAFWSRIERITRRLGVTAVPLLGRELRSADPRRRDAARDALAFLASADDAGEGCAPGGRQNALGGRQNARGGRPTTPGARVRERVIGELRGVATDATVDDAKVCALGLLAELGEHATARFADPPAMQRRSALALAAQLDTPADVASAADLMIHQLDEAGLVQMLEILVEAAPAAAHRLANELGARLDLPAPLRQQITALVEPIAPVSVLPRRPGRGTQVAILVDAAARLVVVASRKVSGERRWRRWAVLIGASGRIDDCLHEDDAGDPGDASPLIDSLCADGYRIASTELSRARAVVAGAARMTALEPERLASPYYLGRDLLDLGDAHLAGRGRGDPASLALGRAVELLAEGDAVRARALLDRCDPDNADVAGALAASLLALGDPAGAAEHLAHAIVAEPEWPLHHWNLAIALQRIEDDAGCYQALRRFIAASAVPSGLFGDPDQPGRVACAERMLVELERAARLTGRSLGPRRRQARRRVDR